MCDQTIVSMTERQEALFRAWREEDPTIITDGLVDEGAYLSSPVKVLYLLKEVNGGESWDLCAFLAEGGRAQTWDNITRWTMGIHQLDRDIPWSQLQTITAEQRREVLRTVCAVNVKKTSGGHTADADKLLRAVRGSRDRLREQLAIYRPDLIVCCGTESLYFEHICQHEPPWEMTSRGIWYAREGDTAVVSYSHPEARVKDCLLYYGLTDAVREILRK